MAGDQVFLLSPAFCGGRRAAMLLRPGSALTLAERLSAGTLTLGEAFAFMSGLYFRGKLAYATRFGQVGQVGRDSDPSLPSTQSIRSVRPTQSTGVTQPTSLTRTTRPTRLASTTRPTYVITPTRGLMPPDALVTGELLREFAAVDVDANDERYRRPLDRSVQQLARKLAPGSRVVLLGSIATGKYVEALRTAFGERLYFPVEFVGRGDMSRGGLMLRHAAAGVELEYIALGPEVARHGPRPPKLIPIPKTAFEGTRG